MRDSTFEVALRRHLAAISARDIATFRTTISADSQARVIGPDGAVTAGYDAIVQAHRGWFESDEVWIFEPSVMMCRSSGALGIALLDVAYREGATQRRFFLSLVFTCENGEWKLLYDQNTPQNEHNKPAPISAS